MQSRATPLLTLIVMTPLLAELGSGNVPPSLFLRPVIWVFALAFFARGMIARWRRGTWHVAQWRAFCFGGIAYAPFSLLIALVAAHMPFAVFIGICVMSVLAYLAYGFGAGMFITPALLRVAVGGYLAAFLFAMVSGIARHALDRALTPLALAAFLLALLRYVNMRDAHAVARQLRY